MKCDVCDTKIPIGQHQCPNCGYKMPIKKVSTFNASSANHEHIESSTQSEPKKRTSFSGTDMSIQAKIEELKKNPRAGLNFLNLGSNPKLGKGAQILIGVVICLAVLSFSVAMIKSKIDYNQYENLTFQEVIDEEYDDGSAQKALDFKDKYVEEFKKIGIEDLNIDEYCNDDNGLVAFALVHGYYEDISYQVSASFQNDEQVSKSLFISGDIKTSLEDEFQGDKKIISHLGRVLGVDNLVKVIDESRVRLIQDEEEGKEVLVYRDLGSNIYITQDKKSSSDLYHFTIMYDFIGY